jgi:predicted ATPase
LVLDNCEHLLAPIADVVEAITQRCPRVAVLATSREGLGLPGERIVAVRSLAVPSEDADLKVLRAGEAVQLFCDRAIAAKSDFTMNDRDAAAVAVLCRRLDGIPLAIELAAARVRSLSPEDLVARLDRRFRLLTRGSRAALERHQTLRSTIDWSYDLLEPREREALARLSVFAGGCDLAAAEAVLADDTLDVFDVVDVLGQLVDKSLVVADRTGEAGPVRYRLLETVRQYAQERLEASGRTETVRGCHAEHYVALAEAAGPHLRSRDQLEWGDRVVQETDNFRAVLDWAIETPSPGHALRLIAPFSIVTGMTIGDAAHELAETACTIPGVEAHPSFPVVAAWASYGATMRRDFDRAEARVTAAEQGQSTLGGPEQAVLRARCVLEFYRGSSERLQPQTQAWLDIARSSGDPYWIASALLMRAGVLAGTDEATATAMVEEAVRLARAAGTVSVLPIALSFLGGLLPIEEVERKRALFSESIEAGTRVGDRMSVAMSSAALGLMAADVGDWRTALRATADAAEQRLHIGDLANLYLSFDAAGVAFAVLGHSEPAAVLITTSDVMNAYRDNYFFLWADMIASISATARETLGERQFEALTQPDTIDLAEIVEYLRSQTERVLADEHADPPSRDAIA